MNGKEYALKDIAAAIGGVPFGDQNFSIKGVAGLSEAGKHDLTHLEGKKYLSQAKQSKAQCFILPEEIDFDAPNGIRVPNVKLAHIEVLKLFDRRREPTGTVSEAAFVDPSAELGSDVTVYPNATIMAGARIGRGSIIYPGAVVEFDARVGEECILHANVVIGERCIIGNRNIFYAGVVIGADGYGYYDEDGKRYKIPQIGIVRTADGVELGANTCIDRATTGETFVGTDTKFDNLSHLAHNCKVGERNYIVAQVGIAGSTTVGNNTILAGQVGVADHVHIGDNVFIAAQSGIEADVADGEKLFLTPAIPILEAHRWIGLRRKIPELFKRVKALEKKGGPQS